MSCASCVSSVEQALEKVPGVREVRVNLADNSAYTVYDEEQTQAEELQKAVQQAGYNLLIHETDPLKDLEKREQETLRLARWRFLGAAVLALPVFVLGMFFPDWRWSPWLSMALTLPVLAVFGQNFFRVAGRLARHGQTNMDTLVALSTGIAFLFSAFNTIYPEFLEKRGLPAEVYFEAAAVIIAFILLGRWLEERAKSGTSQALKNLLNLQPSYAQVIQDDKEIQVAVAEVQEGQILMIRPGEKIPLDGKITVGNSAVDESTITGESIPKEVSAGDEVYAGTLNQKGAFRMEVSRTGDDTLLGQIITTVREAQGSKAPAQRLADRIAAIFVPVVMGLAVLTFLLWMILGGENAFSHALLTAISVLVIACPCALGLATPTAIMVGMGKGAQNQILIRDAASLEASEKIDTVVLDKTGTLTKGEPQLIDQLQLDELELRSAVRSLEQQSEHPLAEAISRGLQDATIQEVRDFQSHTGSGISGKVKGKHYQLGSARMLRQAGTALPEAWQSTLDEWQSQAYTVVYLLSEGKPLGALAVADTLKPDAQEAVQQLQNQNIRVVMLTGDQEATARAIAEQVGITEWEAECLPADKAERIQAWQAKGEKVAMVGDGINDAEALARADVSIAMGQGSDIAMDVAKITLVRSQPSAIPQAFRLAHITMRGIRQNLFWAFIYNIIGIPIAAGILYPFTGYLLNPMIAGAAMALSSVSVVLNSLRIRGQKL